MNVYDVSPSMSLQNETILISVVSIIAAIFLILRVTTKDRR